MSNAPKIAAVLMASGQGKRFGTNKLLAQYKGRHLFHQILEQLPGECFYCVLVVTRYPQIAIAAAEKRFSIVENTSERDDSAETIRMAMKALPSEVDGCMFFVCDQPKLQTETIVSLWKAFLKAPDKIIVPVCHGERGNPVIFPKVFFKALHTLPPGKSGGWVMAAYPEHIQTVEFSDPLEFFDVDTPLDLEMLL